MCSKGVIQSIAYSTELGLLYWCSDCMFKGVRSIINQEIKTKKIPCPECGRKKIAFNFISYPNVTYLCADCITGVGISMLRDEGLWMDKGDEEDYGDTKVYDSKGDVVS